MGAGCLPRTLCQKQGAGSPFLGVLGDQAKELRRGQMLEVRGAEAWAATSAGWLELGSQGSRWLEWEQGGCGPWVLCP